MAGFAKFIFKKTRLPAGHVYTIPQEPTTIQSIPMDDLPTEIIDEIISHLDPPTAVCLALTCHRNYESILAFTRAQTLDQICPKNYYQQPTQHLKLYAIDRNLPHYRSPEKYLWYANSFGISASRFNPAYIQLLLCLRAHMAPEYVFCFASTTMRYVPYNGSHRCSACQSERHYLAQKLLHEFSHHAVGDWKQSPRRWLTVGLEKLLQMVKMRR
jgi:hypothetical protein